MLYLGRIQTLWSRGPRNNGDNLPCKSVSCTHFLNKFSKTNLKVGSERGGVRTPPKNASDYHAHLPNGNIVLIFIILECCNAIMHIFIIMANIYSAHYELYKVLHYKLHYIDTHVIYKRLSHCGLQLNSHTRCAVSCRKRVMLKSLY